MVRVGETVQLATMHSPSRLKKMALKKMRTIIHTHNVGKLTREMSAQHLAQVRREPPFTTQRCCNCTHRHAVLLH